MPLNLISNMSANVAHRNLTRTDQEMSASLAKLSVGTRVLAAKDDAASLAIGSRISAEVSALRQASVNAGQASSMLQIADGAMSTTQDILTRMKTLAVQGASDNLSSTERGMLDTEYQALLNEIDRVANDTEFNGSKLVHGSTAVTAAANSISTAGDNFVQAEDGITAVEFDTDVGNAAFTIDFDADTDVLTLTNLTTGISEGIDVGSTAVAENQTQDVRFDNLGATITLNSAFDKTAAINATGASVSSIGGTAAVLASSFQINSASGSGAQGITAAAVTITATSADNATISVGNFSVTGVDLSSVGSVTAALTDGTDTFEIEFAVTTAFSDGDDAAVDVNALGAMVFADSATGGTTSFTFKVGTGTTASEDDLTLTVDSITQNALGVNGTSLTGADSTNADTALTSINTAIDTLNTARANVGAAQNRLGFASTNLATTIENQEASRSTLMDLDVAAEMANFTSKQVLMQAGVSMLAQANQVPQNLMQLFG